ncbi:MAG: sigma factor-like helix-turn-helix DNA-binding protein [Actinoplanes sp.]
MLNTYAAPFADRETQQPPMEQMLRVLPPQHREIIVATYFRGRTTNEAAQLLGISPTTAKKRLCQAMSDLSLMIAICRQDDAGQ